MFNPEHLEEITGGNTQLAQRILSEFISTTTEDLRRLQQAINTNNPATIVSLAHRIKGAAAAIGATHLQEQADCLEQATSGYQSLFDELQTRFQSIHSTLPNVHQK